MKITDIFEKQRKIYIDFFKEEAAKCQGQLELLLDPKTEESEEYYRLYRFDCVEKEGEEFKIIEFNNDSYINYNLLNYTFREMEIELLPFFWNACELEIHQEIEDWTNLIAWIKDWMEEEEEEVDENKDLSFKIHNCRRPIIAEGKSLLAIDFGTAGIDCLIELIRILDGFGVKKVKIHSKAMIAGQ